MSEQGKNHKNNRLPVEWQKQKMIQPAAQDVRLYNSAGGWSSLSTLQRIVIVVLLVAAAGVIFTLIFEEKDPVQLEASTPAATKPVSDLTVQQGNKLTTVISSTQDPTPTVVPEINQPDDITEEKKEDVSLSQESSEETDVPFPEQERPEQERWFSYTIAPGDTLAKIFRGQQLSLSDLYAIKAIEGADQPVSRIVPNQEVRFKLNESADIDALEIQDETQTKKYVFVRTEQGNFIRKQ